MLIPVNTAFADLMENLVNKLGRAYILSTSGVDIDFISDNFDDLTDIDNPPDPLDEEDPFNPYDFI